MVYMNEEIANAFPREAKGSGFEYKLEDKSGKKILYISKILEGNYISNNVNIDFVRIFLEGSGSIGINVEGINVYKFNNTKFLRGNYIDNNIVKYPIQVTFNGNGYVDIPIFLCDETFEIVFTPSGNIQKIYTAINGTIHNMNKKLLEDYKKI